MAGGNTPESGSLSEDQVAAFGSDGFVVVENLYDGATMAEWKRVVLEVMEAESAFHESGVRVWMADAIHPMFRDAMSDAHVAAMLRQLIGANVEFLSAKAVYKNAETSFATPWHQDWQYWFGPTKLSVWIALDEATPENGCLKVLRGSHVKHFEHLHLDGEQGFVNQIEPEQVAEWSPVEVALPVGGAVFFHDQLVHSSHPNTSGQDRWSMISTYRDASVKDESSVWQNSVVVSGRSVNSEGSGD
ncbi:MAG: hypothetical protein CMJ49_09120 [Planctomycetaceae bacterium]|nr:hypothetical protein [Planctomycetaceae bacterium]